MHKSGAKLRHGATKNLPSIVQHERKRRRDTRKKMTSRGYSKPPPNPPTHPDAKAEPPIASEPRDVHPNTKVNLKPSHHFQPSLVDFNFKN